jgi:RNA recognition motif-containing protein
MNIYVGNLSFTATEQDLKSAFEKHGEVARVSIITDKLTGKSRGFAFVEMEDDEQARAAIGDLNGFELDGRALNVSEARPRQEGRGGGGGRGGGRGRW